MAGNHQRGLTTTAYVRDVQILAHFANTSAPEYERVRVLRPFFNALVNLPLRAEKLL
jgi:hypothetical protein